MTDAGTTPTAVHAGIQAAWTVAIGIVVYLLGNLVIDLIRGIASPNFGYVGHLVLALGLRTLLWAIWVIAIAVRFRDQPPRRRAQLAVGAGLIVAIIDGLITIISSLGSGAFDTTLFTAVPLAIGIVVFTLASAAGAYGSIPVTARAARSR
ncbi:MAG TPA: hypothetical protein VF479_09465 [Pseudolysinimonas sp.]